MTNTSSHQTTASILGKQVRLWDPYESKRELDTKLVGRKSEIRLIASAWMAGPSHLPMSPLLVGQPGVGKNRLVYDIAKEMRKELYIFQGHDDFAAEDLACSIRFSDSDSRQMEFTASPLVTAMHLGQICFIDEIAKIRPRALALLVSVLDERRYIDSNLLGGRVVAKEGFRFIAATNTADLEGNLLPAFIRSRLHPVIQFGYPGREEIDDIVTDRFLYQKEQCSVLLSTFWEEWEKLHIKRPPSPRDAIAIFSLATNHSNNEGAFPGSDYKTYNINGANEMKPEHVSQAVKDLAFGFKEI